LKRLYLIRHAKSSWKDSGLMDFDRPLNNRGKKDAPFMGKRLKKYSVKPDSLISSPAKRALKTAKIVASEIDFPKEKIVTDKLIYEGSVNDLFNLIHDLDNSFENVMLFGHNPDFTSLANYLSTYPVSNIPTCGIFCVDFNAKLWSEIKGKKGKFVFFDYPKKHTSHQ